MPFPGGSTARVFHRTAVSGESCHTLSSLVESWKDRRWCDIGDRRRRGYFKKAWVPGREGQGDEGVIGEMSAKANREQETWEPGGGGY